MKKSLYLLLLIIFNACGSTNYFSDVYGTIKAEDIIRVEYYEKENHLNKSPNSIITDKNKISDVIKEINYSNKPNPWIGMKWDKILIIKADTTITYNTNGKVIGLSNKGTFYKLKDEQFIQRYFKD